MEFVLATEDVNRYGYRLLMSGARLENYKKNPVMLYMHVRSGDRMPVGRFDNLRIEDGKLLGTPVFDMDDELGAKLAKKVENRFVHATSIWLDPITVSDDPQFLLAGQTRPSVTVWELLEASFVDIPGDPGALRLSLNNGQTIDDALPLISSKQPDMQEVKKALGLDADATEAQVLAAIEKVKEERVKSLLSFGEAKKVITEKNKATYERLAKADFDTTHQLLQDTAGPDEVGQDGPDTGGAQDGIVAQLLKAAGAQNQLSKGGDNDRANWTFDDYQKKDPKALNQLRLEKPEQYKDLAKAYAQA